MDIETLDRIGRLADKADNLSAASTIPLPPAAHIRPLRDGLDEIATELRKIYIAETGENPWGD